MSLHEAKREDLQSSRLLLTFNLYSMFQGEITIESIANGLGFQLSQLEAYMNECGVTMLDILTYFGIIGG